MDFENVPVPRKWVTKVYALIAKLEAEEEKSAADDESKTAAASAEGTSAAGVDEEASRVAGRAGTNGNWPEDELARFAKSDGERHPTVIRMLDFLAEQPGKHVRLSAITEQLSIDKLTLRGRLSALTRHLKAHYDFAELGWPMQWEFYYHPKGSRETEYFISPEQAQRWRAARER
jgi:hypothetical protein